MLLREFLRLSCGYHAFTCKIVLIAHQNFANLAITVLLDTFHPTFDIVEGPFIRYIKNNNDALGFSVETICDSFIPFLASCVPDFCNDGCFRTLRGELFCFVINTDRN